MMSKRPSFNRQRVFFSARPRRLVSTFIPVLIGLSGLRVLPLPPITPILTDAAPLFAQSPRLSNERSAVGAVNNEQDQVVFFSIPVAVDAAVVRSGPSEDAYPTGSVGKNRYVEVYFRDADGWCAIRPPQGSFSWINAKFVRRENDSTGRVVASNGKAVPARVGGATVEESAIVQVGLKNGRQVKILEETQLSDGSTWLKIAPPSGEFRWLRSSALLNDPAIAQLPNKLTFQREFLAQLASRASAERSVASSSSNAGSNAAPNRLASPLPALESSARSGQLAQNTQNGRFNETASALANVVPETLPASVVASGASGTTQSSVPSQSPSNASTPRGASFASIPPTPSSSSSSELSSSDASEEFATQFKMEIARLNADVFQVLRQNPPSDAELAVLASRAEYLFDAAPTDGERFVVQSIYDAIKIAERRNRARLNGGNAAQTPGDLSVSPDHPVFPAPNGASHSPFPAQSPQSPFSFSPRGDVEGRRGEFEGEGDVPLLLLPDSSFDASVSAAPTLGSAEGANFPQFAQNAEFNASNAVSPPWGVPDFNSSSAPQFVDKIQNGATGSEKRPRLAFAFSNANNPFRSRTQNKEARVAPLTPQSGERSSGFSKLPPLLPTQKQLIVPPPNYRSGPFGKNDRVDGKSASVPTSVAATSSLRSSESGPAESTTQAAQELTVDSVRWRAVKTDDGASANPVVSSNASPVPATSNGTAVAAATAEVANAENAADKTAKVSPISATVSSKPPVLTGASVPQTPKKSPNASKNAFRPVSSRSVAGFDAYGVLAKLPKAPKGTPQYALTRPVGDRFEIVSYLETEEGVALERYVGRPIGVKGARGTIQIGENTQKLTTVRTVFPQE